MSKVTRRFNYTNRVRIPAKNVHVETDQGKNGGCQAIILKLDLSDSGSHTPDVWSLASVILEARRLATGSFVRQTLGTTADIQSKKGFPLKVSLPGFVDESDITFRVKLVDTSGRLLADGDNIRVGVQSDSDREPLIPLVPTELGEEIWKIDWDMDNPRVLVNKRLPNPSSFLSRDAVMRGLVMPHIIRHVLPRALLSEQKSDRWVEKWTMFAVDLLGDELTGDLESPDEVAKIVDQVVEAFADKQKFATQAESLITGVEEL
jgi:hypothetical protein